MQRSASDQLCDLLKIKAGEDVLDLGCGTGHLTRRIREITKGKVVGVDASEGMIAEAGGISSHLDIAFEICSAGELPYLDSFDVILCNSAFQWFKDVRPVLESCRSALRRRGRMGIQASARKIYCPNFIGAVENVRTDPQTSEYFSTFEMPWLLMDTVEE